ncbi:DinB family protein [Chitinophaga sp.]|uniref:DinB family protein n=1 Tax=Chitinophaga sp. TaxID=1869181 RepID=UPI0031E28E79
MKEVVLNLAGYHLWANQRLATVLKKLTEAQLDQEVVSSFSSIRQTVYHMWDAESVWKQRIELVEQTQKPAPLFQGTFEAACDEWMGVSRQLLEMVQQINPVKLPHTVAYYNSQKQYGKLTVIEILMHVFNHATYHRGQLVTLLRQVGVTKIPGTDYSEYAKK